MDWGIAIMTTTMSMTVWAQRAQEYINSEVGDKAAAETQDGDVIRQGQDLR